jgi:hypothetical protein
MGNISNSLIYFLISWTLITAVLVSLVVYRTILTRKEDDSIFLNKAEETLLVGEQAVLIAKINRLRRPIVTLAALSCCLLFATASLWLWAGYSSF